jgi:hypothetical protein
LLRAPLGAALKLRAQLGVELISLLLDRFRALLAGLYLPSRIQEGEDDMPATSTPRVGIEDKLCSPVSSLGRNAPTTEAHI